jgi:hypothetical protein
MVKRILILLILSSILYSQGRSLPAFIYGPKATSYKMVEDTVSVRKLKLGRRLSDDLYLTSGSEKTFILICDETLLELLPESKILIDRSESYLRIIEGDVILHKQDEITEFCYNVVVENGAIGYIGRKNIHVNINYTDQILSNGIFYPRTDFTLIDKDFIKKNERDGKYVMSLIYQFDLPSLHKEFNLPSKRQKNLRFSTREKTGTASYKSNSYFHAGTNLRLRMQEFEFVYNIWLAISPKEGFYTKNWDEWQDIINNIHHLSVFHPTDPFYFRIGMIEKLQFGRGYLVDNYNNTIILPFENLSGVQIKSSNRKYLANVFLNDITKPRIAGLYYNQRISKRFSADLTYVGDFNQYSNIIDSDKDSYPDKVDPQDNTKNLPDEMIVSDDGDTTYTNDLISLDDFDKNNLHAFGLGLKYQVANIAGSDVYITGDLAWLSTPSMGISLPNLYVGNDIFEVGVGADFQSHDFRPSIFGRSYEYKKARFIKNINGEYELITRDINYEDEKDGWFTGWNTYFNLKLSKMLNLKTRYREVNRDDEFNRHVMLSIKSKYSFSQYLKSYSIFMDHKDFDKIFKEKTDGQIFGFSVLTRPHEAIDVNFRYLQQIQDKDGDGKILKDDVERNFSLNILLDTNYWWKKYHDRKKNKD